MSVREGHRKHVASQVPGGDSVRSGGHRESVLRIDEPAIDRFGTMIARNVSRESARHVAGSRRVARSGLSRYITADEGVGTVSELAQQQQGQATEPPMGKWTRNQRGRVRPLALRSAAGTDMLVGPPRVLRIEPKPVRPSRSSSSPPD